MAKPRPLNMYLAYVTDRHMYWDGRGESRSGAVALTSRVGYPICATSIRHAKALAGKMWPSGEANIRACYIGPCHEPKSEASQG